MKHQHDWKRAPHWVLPDGWLMFECFGCRGLRKVRIK